MPRASNAASQVLRPFDPTLDKPRANADGSFSTELTRTVQTPSGWANVPSLWWGERGPVDLGTYSDDELAEFALSYEQSSGRAFPRFQSVDKAESAAKTRSAKGGATQSKLATKQPEFVDRFDTPTASDGQPIVDRFDEKPIDYSTLGEFDAKTATQGQQWRLAFGYLTTPNEKARADIIRKVLPGARIDKDPNNGRLIVSYKGDVGYIDKPGVTMSGVMDSFAQVAKYLPAGKAASFGGNLLSRMAIAGGGAALTSVGEDVAAIPQGSEQGVSVEKAAATGIASSLGQAAGELIVAPAVQWLSSRGARVWQAIRGQPGAVQNGTLTEVGRRLAQQAGLDPDQMTPDLAQQLESAARRATAAGLPDEQLGIATERQALSQRFRVPLTRGELTDDYAQQSLEENLRKMDITTRAGEIMRTAERESSAALRGEGGESGFGLLRRQVGGQAPADVAQSGQAVITSTQARGAAARNAYQGAYRTARDLGASLDARNYRQFLGQAEDVLKESVDYDPNLYPQTSKMIENLRGRLVFMEETGREAPRKIPLAKLENLRKIINAQWKSADATDRMGLDVLRNQFDEMVDGALESGRVTGDQAAVEAWRAGRQLFGRFQQLYGVDKQAGQAEQFAGREVRNWLRSDNVTGEEVIRKAVQNRALTQRILQINGEESPAHQALKQGALEYVFRPALKGEGISPRLIVSSHERWFRGAGREQMEAIFSPADRQAIDEFVRLARAKIPQGGVENFSNSGNVLVKGAQQLLNRLGFIGAATGNVETAAALSAANMITRGVRGGQAASAIQGLAPRPTALGAAAGAGGVTDEYAGKED
jgi:hypothetical protein